MSDSIKYCHRCERDVQIKKDVSSNAAICSVCGTIIAHSANHLPQGTILNGFEINGELGRGGMGIVYLANQLNLDRQVALKVLSDDLARDDEFVERFFKEARAAASLNHPNIVQVFDAGSTLEGIYYFAMELISGETIEQRIERTGPFPPKDALKIAVKISDALDYAWKSQKLTHGDIKPENIILNEMGEAKLADLGLAKFTHEEVSTDGIMVTPLYAPPEIIRADNRKISFKSDMYSFGATLYQMLAGVPPFPDGPPEEVFLKHLNETPPSLSMHNERLSAPLVRIVDNLLAKDPDGRAESWESLCKSLKRIKEPEGVGKVFHKRTHLHDTRDDTHPGKREHLDGCLSGEDPELSSATVSFIIKALSAAALVLLVVIAVVVSTQNRSHSKKTPEAITVSAADTPVRKGAYIHEKWASLRRSMNAMNDKDAYAALKELTDKYGNQLPPEALEQCQKLKAKLQTPPRKLAEITLFNASADNTEQLVKRVMGSLTKTASQQLRDCKESVNALLNRSLKTPYLKLSDKRKFFFRSSVARINKELVNRKSRALLAKREIQRKKRLEELARRKMIAEKRRERRAEKLAVAASTDAYYKILAVYERKSNLSLLEKSLAKWKEKFKTVDEACSQRVDLLLKTIIPNSRLHLGILKRRENDLKGRRLPNGVCSAKFSRYTVKEFDESGIKLILKKRKVFLGHTLKWSKISPQKMVALLKKTVLDSKMAPPSQREERIVLSYAVLESPDAAGYLLTSLRTLKLDEVRRWKSVIRDMNEASAENALIFLYARMREDMKSGRQTEASEKFIKLTTAGKDSLFAKRYADELKSLKPLFASINPKIVAADWINTLLGMRLDDDNMAMMFNYIMCVYARYGNDLSSLDRQIVDEFSSRRDEVVLKMVEKSGVTEMKANRVPFYYWVREHQGGAWAFFNLMKDRPIIKDIPKLVASMKLAASLDNGDWKTAGDILAKDEGMTAEELAGLRRLRSWAPSFLFAKGIVATQLGDIEKMENSRDTLVSLVSDAAKLKNSPMVPLSTALAMELALALRDNKTVIRTGARYVFNKNKGKRWWRLESRIPLLEVLARATSNQTPSKAIGKFQARYKGIPKLSGDLLWLNSAAELIANHALNPKRIRALAAKRCYFYDTMARIMASALAKYHVETGGTLNQERILMAAIERSVSSSIVSSGLWRRTLLLRLAGGKTPQDLKKEAVRSLADLRISSTPAYPLLMELKIGAEVAEGKLSPVSAKHILTDFLNASSVAASDEVKNLSVMTDEDPAATVQRLFAARRPLAAVRAALLAIATREKPALRSAVASAMRENASALQWEELYLLQILERWRH